MTSRNPARLRRAATGVLATLLLAALAGCGPTTHVSIGVRNAPVNVRLGNFAEPLPPPLGAPTSGLGFITAPVRLDLPPTPPGKAPLAACPSAPPNVGAEEAAPTVVLDAPKAGIYRFRRNGFVRTGDAGEAQETLARRPQQPLSSIMLQEVTNVVRTDLPTMPEPRITFDVVQTEPGLRTTTSYLIDPVGSNADTRVSAGLKITRVVLERPDLPGDAPGGAAGEKGVEIFSPQPPVKIMNLPAVVEPAPIDGSVSSRGTDPASGASMEVFSATQTRASVDICGRVIQGWRVRVSFPGQPTGSWMSTYDRTQVRTYTFVGDFVFAPQFGLIVQQDLTFYGTEVGERPFDMHSSATINSLNPA